MRTCSRYADNNFAKILLVGRLRLIEGEYLAPFAEPRGPISPDT
jgi:hypothetical protein